MKVHSRVNIVKQNYVNVHYKEVYFSWSECLQTVEQLLKFCKPENLGNISILVGWPQYGERDFIWEAGIRAVTSCWLIRTSGT